MTQINSDDQGSTSDEANKTEKRRWWSSGITPHVIVFILIFTAGLTFVSRDYIPSASMEPTVAAGSTVTHLRIYPGMRFLVKRGSVVTFTEDQWSKETGRESGTKYLKRVVAVEGDKVGGCSDDGRLLVNDQALSEDYLKDPTYTKCDFEPVTVPDGKFWAMSDNRRGGRDTVDHYFVTKNEGSIPSTSDIVSLALF